MIASKAVPAMAIIAGLALASPHAQARDRAQARDTFDMVCAGGSANTVSVIPGRSAVEIEINFRRAPKAWKDSNGSIPAGTCTWVDRPMSAGEPTRFRMRLSETGKAGFNPRSLFIPGTSPVTRSSRKYLVNVGQRSSGGLVVRVNEEVAKSGRNDRRGWSEIGRIDLSQGKLFTVQTKSLGDAMALGRITDGAPRIGSEGIDLRSGRVKTR